MSEYNPAVWHALLESVVSDNVEQSVGSWEHDAIDGNSDVEQQVHASMWDAYITSAALDSEHDMEAEEVQPLFNLESASSQPSSSSIPVRRGRPRKALQELFSGLPKQVSTDRGMSTCTSEVIECGTEIPLHLGKEIYVFQRHELVLAEAKGVFTCSTPGFAPHCSLVLPLLHAVEMSLKQGAKMDSLVYSLANRYVHAETFHLASISIMEEQYQIHKNSLVQRLDRLASAVAWLQRHDRRALEKLIIESIPPKRCLCYFDCQAYDETPMLTSFKSRSSLELAELQHNRYPGIEAAEARGLADLASALPNMAFAAKAKLLQVTSLYGCLISEPSCLVFGETLDPLEVLARTSAENIQAALNKTTGVSQSAEHFVLKVRSVAVDQARANQLCEDSMVQQRGPTWNSFVMPCTVHRISLCLRKTFESLLPDTVSGMVKTTLSILDGGKMSIFRRALQCVLQDRPIEVVQGGLPAEVCKRRSLLMKLFIHRHPQGLSRQVMLDGIANGDWSRKDCLMHVVPSGKPVPSVSNLKTQFQLVLMKILAGSNPPLFPRHRWIGAESAICYFGLLHYLHGLLEPTMTKFMELVSERSTTIHANPVGVTMDDMLSSGNHTAEALSLDQTSWVAGGVAAEEALASIPEGLPGLNAKNRSESAAWIQSHPEGELFVMQMIVRPLADLMTNQLTSSGAQYEQSERAKMAAAMLSGTYNVQSRSFQLVQAASGQLEHTFLGEISKIMTDHESWDLVTVKTSYLRGIAHRLLARAGSAVYQLVWQPHTRFPCKLFSILAGTCSASEIANLPQCMKDEWTLSIQREYQDLQHDDVSKLLQAQATLQKCDIASIEAQHASLRRFLLGRSVQTWRFGVKSCSAERVLQNSRRLLDKQMHKKRHVANPKVVRGSMTIMDR
eukprot:6492285-Amphidinium_carterae.3